MSERKVLNKYVSPHFNHEKLVKLRKPKERQDNVRMMLPFSFKCDTCGNYFRIATKINMRKEIVDNEDYLGIAIHRFYMKCLTCYTEISMKTDPKNHDYTLEHGGTRMYESWKDARAAEEFLKKIKENEEEGNAIKTLEHKTYDSKKEMEASEAIDELRNISRKNAKFELDDVVDSLNKRDFFVADEEIKQYQERLKNLDIKKNKNGSNISNKLHHFLDHSMVESNIDINNIKKNINEAKNENLLKKCLVSTNNYSKCEKIVCPDTLTKNLDESNTQSRTEKKSTKIIDYSDSEADN